MVMQNQKKLIGVISTLTFLSGLSKAVRRVMQKVTQSWVAPKHIKAKFFSFHEQKPLRTINKSGERILCPVFNLMIRLKKQFLWLWREEYEFFVVKERTVAVAYYERELTGTSACGFQLYPK